MSPVALSSRSTANKPQQAAQLPSLTSLRGLAALWVVLYHYTALDFPRLDITPHSHLIGKGYLAVDLFFMLSGFVMTHVYHRAFCDSVAQNYRSFLAARVARLYPLHLATLLLFVITALAAASVTYLAGGGLAPVPLYGTHSFVAFIANLFMLQGLHADTLSWNYPSWSISVEFMAYLVFPLLLPAIWKAGKYARLAALLVVLATLAVFTYLCGDNFNQWKDWLALLRCLPEFILGTLIYCAWRDRVGARWLSSDAAAAAMLVAVVVCLHFGAPDIVIVALFPALILAALINTGRIASATTAAPLIWLGEVSFSLYLIHGLVAFVADKLIDGAGVRDHGNLSIAMSAGLAIAMLTASLIVSHVSYRTVETVWRKQLRALLGSQEGGKRKTAAAGGPVGHAARA
jgi:peptidoglycan/LPS O-acetylase OafA/YrhL